MKNTLDLLNHAKKSLSLSERALSMRLGRSPTNLTTSKQKGSLSPILAGKLAELVGEDVKFWMAAAAIESEPKSPETDHLRRLIQSARNS